MGIESKIIHFAEDSEILSDPVTNAVNGTFWNLKDPHTFSDDQVSEILDTARSALMTVETVNGGLWNSTGIVVDRIGGRLDITFRGAKIVTKKSKDDETMPKDKKVVGAVFATISGALNMLQFGTNDPRELKKKRDQSRIPIPRYGFKATGGNGRKTRQPNRESDNNSR